MVKDFQLLITPPPQGVFVSDVTGHVLVVTEEAKQSYKCIQVTLRGYADVRWSETHGSGDNRRTVTYHSHEDYIYQTVILWSRENALNHELSPGSYQFPFALTLQPSGRPLPPSFEGTVGHIRYEVEATIVRASALKRNERITAQIAVAPVVDPNIVPNVRLPKVLQVEKTLCCLCCASGPISLTARVPRTGFCIIQDAIPFEVDIENGSNRRIRQLVAQLQKQVVYTAQGHHQYSIRTVAEVASDPIEPGNSRSWRPPPLPVPATEPTIASCSIIQVNYYLKIKAAISGAINPHVDFVLFLGNVPLSGVEGATISQSPPPSKTCMQFLRLGLLQPHFWASQLHQCAWYSPRNAITNRFS